MTFKEIQERIDEYLNIEEENIEETEKEAFNRLIEKTLSELASKEEEKVDGFAYSVQKATAMADFLEEYAKKKLAMAKTLRNRVSYLKAHYIEVMQQHGLKKIQGRTSTISIRNTDVCIQKEEDLKLFPEEFLRKKETVELNKVALKDYLKKTEDGVLYGVTNSGHKISIAFLAKRPSLIIK